ncbi:histidine kinase [Niabella sp. CJ426]|uniref:tetratricopeptide repeat-containing sensor histidine kinase n=1 Tax=Niabella sp. CJ426 TaxID=3393740 RepID=UPI003D01261A
MLHKESSSVFFCQLFCGLLFLCLFWIASCNPKREAFQHNASLDSIKTTIKSLLKEAYSYQEKNVDSVLYFADSSQRLAGSIKDTNSIISASYVKAHALANSGKFKKAITEVRRAIQLTEQSGNKDQYLPVLYTMGGIYAQMDVIDSATFYFLQAYKKIDGSTRITDIAALTNSLGFMMGAQGNKRLAAHYLAESLHSVEQLKDTVKILYTLINLISYSPMENKNDSLHQGRYIRSFLRMFNQTSPTYLNAVIYGSAGSCYEQLGQPDSALFFYRKAIAASSKDGNILFQKDHLYNVAEIYMSRGQYDSALHFITIDSNRYNSEASLQTQYRYYSIMSRLHEHYKQWAQAVSAIKSSSHIDSLINKREKSDQLLKHEQEITRLKAEKQLIEKEKSIALQRNRVLILSLLLGTGTLVSICLLWFQKQKRRQLKKERELAVREAQEKEDKLYNDLVQQEMVALFAKLNPHFVFNALNPLTVFLLKNQNKEALAYLNRVALLMRGFINLSQIQFATVNDVLVFLRHYITVQQHRFDFSFEYREDIDLALDTLEYLIPALLLQPIIENAIEHGVTHIGYKGSIDLRMRLCSSEEQENVIEIHIVNDGPPMDENLTLPDNHALSIIQEQLLTIRKKYGTGNLILQNKTGQPGVRCVISLPAITLHKLKIQDESNHY